MVQSSCNNLAPLTLKYWNRWWWNLKKSKRPRTPTLQLDILITIILQIFSLLKYFTCKKFLIKNFQGFKKKKYIYIYFKQISKINSSTTEAVGAGDPVTRLCLFKALPETTVETWKSFEKSLFILAVPKLFVFIYHWTVHKALDMGLLVPFAFQVHQKVLEWAH